MFAAARSPARICLVTICAACCGAEEKGGDPVIGGVYVARELLDDRLKPIESIWPLLALRVDLRKSDALLVKYRFQRELSADADFRYQSACDCFKSQEDLVFELVDPKRLEVKYRRAVKFRREEVFLNFRPGELDLWYFEDAVKKGPYIFRMTYVDTVDLSTHRHPYYSEDGFGLFPPLVKHKREATVSAPKVRPCRRLESTHGEDAGSAGRAGGTASETGRSFRDCTDCPEIVVVPAGRFWMGCEPDRGFSEYVQPAHEVRFARRFALSRHETTFAQWDACVAGGGCDGYRPEDHGMGRGDWPVINVNWRDARNYASWLSEKTGKSYRLPSEAEWEYAARAGSTTRYSWGDDVGRNRANFDLAERERHWALPVGSFAPNAFGLHDMHGNVMEWVEDCWNYTYDGVPSNGSAWLSGDCVVRVTRGGAWDKGPHSLRSASRNRGGAGLRNPDMGFRVALTLPE